MATDALAAASSAAVAAAAVDLTAVTSTAAASLLSQLLKQLLSTTPFSSNSFRNTIAYATSTQCVCKCVLVCKLGRD